MRTRGTLLVFAALSCGALATSPRAAHLESITLERTSCFGTCPIYKLTLRRDGTVTYVGKAFVKVTGHHSRRIPVEKFEELAREIKRIGFFTFKDEYFSKQKADGSMEFVTDQPTRIITVRAGKSRKRVKNYYGGPEPLAHLEKLIDSVAGSSIWTGSDPNEI